MDAATASAFGGQGLTVVEDNKEAAQPGGAAGAAAAGGAGGGAGGSAEPGAGGGGGEAGAGGAPAGSETPFFKDGKFDEAAFIAEVFGEKAPFKSVADIKAAKLADTLADYGVQKNKVTELSESLSKKYRPFHNDRIEKLNVLSRESKIDDISLLSKLIDLDVTKADSKTLLTLHRMLKTPSLASKQSVAERMIERDYNFAAIDADATLDDQAKADAKELLQADMDAAADEAKKTFSELLSKAVIQKPEDIEAAEKAEIGKAREGWTPVIGKIQQSMKSVKFEAGKQSVDFEVPTKSMEAILNNALDFASKSYGANIADNIPNLLNYIDTLVLIAHKADISKAWMKKGRDLSDQDWIAESSNPSGFNTDKAENKGTTKTWQDDLFNFFGSKK